MRNTLAFGALALVACTGPAGEPQYAFYDNMADALCGGTFEGRVVSDDTEDADWRDEVLVLGPVDCSVEPIIRMPLAVGDDTSRTWHLSYGPESIMFRHQHVEPDGSPSAVTNYGGTPSGMGTPYRQSFPADAATQENFLANRLEPSIDNVWSLTLEPGETLTYALARPERDFRAEFDLSEP